ncbi:MAG: hypothetical protein JO356_05400 [Acidobacteria bacterium]|nr:hypothetical protein [Acidobacteriota bacterium]
MRWAIRRQYLIDGYRLNEKTADQVIALVRRCRPVALFGFTSMLEFVARSVLERGIALPQDAIRVAWNGGEMLFDHQRALFRKAFGVPILNLYGGRELSAMAFESFEGARLQILRPLVYLEIVDDAGKPALPGEPGRVIATSLVCRGTPFLRYDIGDLASYNASDQDESGIRALDLLHGRRSAVIPLPDGRRLHCLFWNHLLKDYPEVHQFQVVLRGSTSLTLRLKGQQLADSRQAELRYLVQRALGGLAFDLEWCERLPLTSQGKLLQVIRE